MSLLATLGVPPGVASLMKYSNLTSAQLTTPILKEISSALGYTLPITDEVTEKVVVMLREGNIDSLADLMSNQTVMDKLGEFLNPQPEAAPGRIEQCRHCNKLNYYE